MNSQFCGRKKRTCSLGNSPIQRYLARLWAEPVPVLDSYFYWIGIAQKIGRGRRKAGKSGWHRGRAPILRRVKAGPVRRIDPREPWPSDDLAQVARRNGLERLEMFALLERQGHRCALCGVQFHPWRVSPRLADESPDLVCVGCKVRLRLASGAYWEREAKADVQGDVAEADTEADTDAEPALRRRAG